MPDAIDAMVERVRVLTIQRNVAQARARSLEHRFGITRQLSDDHVMAMHRDAEMSAARDARQDD
jgi:hypothetical protein